MLIACLFAVVLLFALFAPETRREKPPREAAALGVATKFTGIVWFAVSAPEVRLPGGASAIPTRFERRNR